MATISEAADVTTYFPNGVHPPYASQGATSIPSWAIPYSSLKRCFVDYLDQPMEYRIVAGWHNTAPFGHERMLFEAFLGEY